MPVPPAAARAFSTLSIDRPTTTAPPPPPVPPFSGAGTDTCEAKEADPRRTTDDCKGIERSGAARPAPRAEREKVEAAVAPGCLGTHMRCLWQRRPQRPAMNCPDDLPPTGARRDGWGGGANVGSGIQGVKSRRASQPVGDLSGASVCRSATLPGRGCEGVGPSGR
jgi:hypothetical protein